jgi:RimJ/RimL family protein N-acetyltransferase
VRLLHFGYPGESHIVGGVLVPTYPLVTPRLSLRPLTADDFADVHAYWQLPEVARYLYWEAATPEQTRDALERNIRRTALREEGDGLVLAVVPDGVGRVVGQVTLRWTSREHRQGEVGFILNPAFQGRGLATEAAGVLLDLGFDQLGLHRIAGRCDTRNLASVRVMQRLGMRREAHFVHDEIFKGEWGDQYVYATLDDEWRERKRKPR